MAEKGANLRRISYVVFDHTDALIRAGFGPRLRSIANNLHPARQISVFASSKTDTVQRRSWMMQSADLAGWVQFIGNMRSCGSNPALSRALVQPHTTCAMLGSFAPFVSNDVKMK